MTLCLSACTENAGATGKTEEASTENTEVTEQAQKYLETGDDDVRFVQADTERFGNRILFSWYKLWESHFIAESDECQGERS